jgi:hypothetical protein
MACIQVLQGTATWLPFIAADVGTGSPRTGITSTQIDVSYKKSTQSTFNLKVITPSDFRENGSGVYELLFSTSELDTLGSFLYVANGNGSLPLPNIRQFVGQAFILSSSTFTPGTISLSTNILTGNIIDLNGVAMPNVAVSARVLAMPTLLGTTPNRGGITTDIVSARTDSAGFFALELVQEAVVDVTIPRINYRRTLTVPTNSTDILFDLA